MRLVQRHGRIGSPHPRVFLRTVFPADRLDQLLALETRILRKLTQAAKSIGVAISPIHGTAVGDQVFAETRSEIEKLAQQDPTLFEQGGTAAAAQTGEEYRQRLRAALQVDRAAITGLPGRAGSGLQKGKDSGVLFCAEVELAEGRRTFLRFVPATADWRRPADDGAIVQETGTCLRLIDCAEDTARYLPEELGDGIFAFWEAARESILAEWDDLADPANLQPQVRLLNRQVAAFIRAHPPNDLDPDKLNKALDILEVTLAQAGGGAAARAIPGPKRNGDITYPPSDRVDIINRLRTFLAATTPSANYHRGCAARLLDGGHGRGLCAGARAHIRL